MPTYVSAGDSKTFEPAPEGLWTAICVDVVDKGEQPTQWGPKRKVQLRWQLGEDAGVRDDGKPWLVTRTFTASLSELAHLTELLVRWRGKQFTKEELEQFDLDTVIGAPGLANIVHNVSDDGRIFANVDTVMPLPKAMARPVIRDYVRQRDREPQAAWPNGTLEERNMDDAFAQTVSEPPAPSAAHDGDSKPDPDLLAAGLTEPGDTPKPTSEEMFAACLTWLDNLSGDTPASSRMVKAVQNKHPGKPWTDLTYQQQAGILDYVRTTVSAILDKEAAKQP